jgi:hypothetical protein
MGTASLQFDRRKFDRRRFGVWNLAWHNLRGKLTARRGPGDCPHVRARWNSFMGRPRRILLDGSSYCLDRCLEGALAGAIVDRSRVRSRMPAYHRIPLGLLLIAREQITGAQLRTALAAQSAAGRGRIGEWLETLGYASERQITGALARQWSCPVLSSDPAALHPSRVPRIPPALLRSFSMFPVDFVVPTATLHMAFSEGVDYGALHAIEQMLGCRTEACLALPSLLRPHLEALTSSRDESEMVFDRVEDVAELARIVCSYAARVSASEIRLASCGEQIWGRLLGRSNRQLDLLLRTPSNVARLGSMPRLPGSV